MALMRRGALFAGALFAGVLFGPAAQTSPAGRVIHRPVFLSPTPARPTAPVEDDEALLLAILM